MTKELTRREHLDLQAAEFGKMLEGSPDGEYHVPHLRFTTQTPENAAFQVLIHRLSMYFPEYIFSQSDSLDPNVYGITIRWQKKVKAIERSDNIS